MHARRVLAGTLIGVALLVGAGCGGSSSKTASPTSAATTASTGGGSTMAPTTAASGTSGGSGTRLDRCADTNAQTVATTFLSSINYAGADTYMQCVYQDTVPASIGPQVKAKNFSSLSPTFDAATTTATYTAPDGTKLVLTMTKQANGKYYVTKASLS